MYGHMSSYSHINESTYRSGRVSYDIDPIFFTTSLIYVITNKGIPLNVSQTAQRKKISKASDLK